MKSAERFRRALDRYLDAIDTARRERRSEAQRRHLFLAFLATAFRNIEAAEFDLEHRVLAKVRGFIDVLYQDIVFEFKRDLTADREDGKQKLARYIAAIDRKGGALGVLTDGVIFEVYILRGAELVLIDEADLGRMAAASPDAAFLWLDSFLFSAHDVAPTSDDIVQRFGEHSALFASASTWFRELYRRVESDSTVVVKFQEWGRLLAKVYGTQVADEELFIRHTYLSLLARVIAFMTVFRQRPRETDIPGIIDGRSFRRRRPGLRNLSEQDFFAWTLQPDVKAESISILRGFAQHLAIYDLTKIHEDLLKELYQGLVDPQTRHDLGEFYTPDWLAELTLKEAGFSEAHSLLDPACGSGTFLFTAVRLLKQKGLAGEDLVNHALSHISGMDVHPLAVAIAKANYVLALADDLKGYRGHVTIPVHMADSLLKPEAEPDKPILVPVGDRQRFMIPEEMSHSPVLLDRVVETMADYAVMEADVHSLTEGFAGVLRGLGLAQHLGRWAHNLRLMHRLVRTGRDTVWGWILRNAYRPIYLAHEKVSLVAGNPPWLAYRFIQDPGYQQHVKALVMQYGLLDPKDVKLFTQMDTSTLFFVHCFSRYVDDVGTIAFVMPNSVRTGAKQHSKFQGFGFVRAVDLEAVSPLFSVPACVLISRKKESRCVDIPTLRLAGDLPSKNVTWSTAQRYLKSEETAWTPPGPTSGISPYHERFKTGAAMFPRSFWFVEPAVPDSSTPYLHTDPEVDAAAKAPWKGIKREGEVEREFLYATLLTKNMVPFGIVKLSLVVLPVRSSALGCALVTREDAIGQGFTRLETWLASAEHDWERLKKTANLSLLGRLDYYHYLTCQDPHAPYRVMYGGTGSHIASCVLAITEGQALRANDYPAMGFFAQHKTYQYETRVEAEAHYLCAVLNSPLLDAVIKPYQPKGLFGAKRGAGERGIERRPFEVAAIPTFDSDDTRHVRLAEISAECHRLVSKMVFSEGAGVAGLRKAVRQVVAPQLREIDTLLEAVLGDTVRVAKRKARRRPPSPTLDLEVD